MGNKINVTGPDGRTYAIDEELAAKMTPLGYGEEGAGDQATRLRTEAEATHYGGTGQSTLTALEGLADGATVGMSTLLLDDAETRARARHNPGIRLATEITGAIAPALLTGGTGALAKAASITPAALATRAGAGVARATGKGVATSLAVEGAIQGAGTAASHAVLNSDPLTIEAIAAGAGMGALFGAGFGMMSRGLSAAGRQAETRIATKQVEAAEAALSRESPALRRASEGLQEITAAAKRAVAEVNGALTPAALQSRMDAIRATGDDLLMQAGLSKITRRELNRAPTKAIAKAASSSLKAAKSAMRAKDFVGADMALNSYGDALQALSGRVGIDINIPARAVESVGSMVEASAISRMPASPAAIASMGDEAAEGYFESLRRVLNSSGDELDPIRGGIVEDLDAALREAGMAPESLSPDGVIDAFKSYRVQLREVKKLGPSGPKNANEKTFLGFIKRVGSLAAARKASSVARAAGAGAFGSALAYHGSGLGLGMLAAELSGLRAAATTHLDEVVAKIAPKAAKTVQRISPISEQLRSTLMGDRDEDPKKDHRQLAKDRLDEIARMSPMVNDLAFSAVEPLIPASPEVALKLAQQMISGFKYLSDNMPRDPGATNIGLQSDWVPSDSEAMKIAGMYQACTSPMEAFERVCTGDGDPATAEALWAVHPALMQEGAVRLIERLPELQANTDLQTRAALSTAFRVPLDGLLYPQSIAALQAIYIPVAPEKSGGGGGGGGSGGRPPKVSGPVSNTRTQTLTAM